MDSESSIQIFSGDNGLELRVELVDDTVWLTQAQMVELFDSSKTNISEHITHVFDEGELEESAVVRKFRTTASDGKSYNTKHYNLDVIISVGYRVKSLRGTQFRIWATDVLKHHLLDGYTQNKHRLEQIGAVLNVLSRSSDEMVAGIANVLDRFSNGLDLLDSYDHQTLVKPKGEKPEWELTYSEARTFINTMSFSETSNLFGVERDESFKGVVAGIY